MNEKLTHIILVIDRSGSMDAVRTDAIGGFNTFLEDQKKHPDEATVTLALFNHKYSLVHDFKPIQEVEKLDMKTYVPQGQTALLDAIGRTMDDVGKKLVAIQEDERPSKVIMAILTDGMENASSDYSRAKILEMIKQQEESYGWQIMYLAANQDAIREGASLGVRNAASMNYASDKTPEVYARMSEAVSRHRTTGKSVDLADDASAGSKPRQRW